MKTPAAIRSNEQSAFTSVQRGVLQRQCICGQHTITGKECEDCQKKRSLRQPLDFNTSIVVPLTSNQDFSRVQAHPSAEKDQQASGRRGMGAAQQRHPRLTGLLINQSIVRAWMWEAYRRSRMGGYIPPAYLPSGVSEERRRRQGFLPTQRECGGKILRAPTGSLHCAFFCTSSATPYSIPVCPSELRIRGNQIGQSTIIGSFHTHPSPSGQQSPSDADLDNMLRAPECQGQESYVIGLDNIYVIFPNRTFRIVGNTGDLLFGGSRRVRP